MEPKTLQYVAAACGGELTTGSPAHPVRRVTTDSRQIQPGDLFVPVKGERFDGHHFLRQVAACPSVSALVERGRQSEAPPGLPRIMVNDTRRAFGDLAGFYRREFDLPVVAVGGSNGKTTTKELIAAVLGAALPVLKSEASFNNDIGVPATLLRLESGQRAAVLEVGSNHPGELAPLVRLIAPRLGVITHIGREHLEFFQTLEGVVQEEGWLAELLPPASDGGVLILDGAGPWAETLIGRTHARIVRVGFGPANEWTAGIRAMDWSGTTFSVRSPHPEWRGEYLMNLPGRHSVPNALYALAVACELGVEPAAARDGLAAFQPPPHRLRIRAAAGVQILDDTYNANADSVLAGLQTLSDLPCAGRRVAVLGDLAELGPQTETAHAEVGKAAARLGIDAVYAVGRCAAITAGAAGQGLGHAFADLDTAAAAIVPQLGCGDAVLVKASRSSRLERLVEKLLQELELRLDPQFSDAA